MDCKTARAVWNHPNGFIPGVRQELPGVVERLEEQVRAFVEGRTNVYDTEVRRSSGVEGRYYNDHADTEDDPIAIGIHDVVGDVVGRDMLQKYFSEMFGRPIVFGNMCCANCITHDGTLTDGDLLKLQIAAVNTEPDGSQYIPG